jgi:hypothetical protein
MARRPRKAGAIFPLAAPITLISSETPQSHHGRVAAGRAAGGRLTIRFESSQPPEPQSQR